MEHSIPCIFHTGSQRTFPHMLRGLTDILLCQFQAVCRSDLITIHLTVHQTVVLTLINLQYLLHFFTLTLKFLSISRDNYKDEKWGCKVKVFHQHLACVPCTVIHTPYWLINFLSVLRVCLFSQFGETGPFSFWQLRKPGRFSLTRIKVPLQRDSDLLDLFQVMTGFSSRQLPHSAWPHLGHDFAVFFYRRSSDRTSYGMLIYFLEVLDCCRSTQDSMAVSLLKKTTQKIFTILPQ